MTVDYREAYGLHAGNGILFNHESPRPGGTFVTRKVTRGVAAILSVIPALIKKCIDARQSGADRIDVWGTGAASREFLYVDDAAEGIVLAAEKYDGAEPINLGTGQEITIRELVGLVAEATGFTGEIRWDPTKPDGQPRRALDTAQAHERFGFVARMPWENGLGTTIDWYQRGAVAARATAESE